MDKILVRKIKREDCKTLMEFVQEQQSTVCCFSNISRNVSENEQALPALSHHDGKVCSISAAILNGWQIVIAETKLKEDTVDRNLLYNHELAIYQRMPDAVKINYKTLEKDGFDRDPLFFCYVATCNEKLIGYAFGSYTYSPWTRKSMFMEDLYVAPDFRQKSLRVGSKILKAVAKDALENDCNKLDFMVLNWNTAQKFYKKLGASDLTIIEKWHHYRFADAELKKLASME